MKAEGTAWNIQSACKNKFKKSCILLAIICNNIKMHGHTNVICFCYNIIYERAKAVCTYKANFQMRVLVIKRFQKLL
jgi:hypothetical protein